MPEDKAFTKFKFRNTKPVQTVNATVQGLYKMVKPEYKVCSSCECPNTRPFQTANSRI